MNSSAGFLGSVLLHALVLAAGGAVFAKPVEYAVQSGSGGLELILTAAPVEPTAETGSRPPAEMPVEFIRVEAEDGLLSQYALGEQRISAVEAPKAEPKAAASDSKHRGDGSSPVPGRDRTTLYSEGGAWTEARPNYLKNPAPPYPLSARVKGWEGLVVLRVAVDKFGRAASVEKEAGSGFEVLDQSALKTVRAWRFRPAQLGSLPVESVVRVPVRFKLENLKA